MSIILPEKIKLRTESLTELTHLELDQNQQYVANSWSPLRKYKEGMIVVIADDTTTVTGSVTGDSSYSLSWWRASVDHGPNAVFDISKWDPIGAQALTGEIAVKDDDTSLAPTNTVLLDFGNNLEVTMVGSTARIDVTSGIASPWQTISGGSEIYYNDTVLIGTTSAINSHTLQVVGTAWVSGNITLGGTIDGVDLAAFKNNYDSHQHYISNASSSLTNLTQISDITISSLLNGDVLKYNSSTQRWVNSPESVGTHTIESHSDANISTPSVSQFLVFDGSDWVNLTIGTNATNGLTSPLAHNHNSLYYTQSNLQASGGAIVNWDNIIGAPTSVPDDEPFLLATAPVGTPLTNYRVLLSDSTINITDGGATGNMTLNVINRSNIQKVTIWDNSVNAGNHSNIDFVDSATLQFDITQITGGDYISISADVVGLTNVINAINNSSFLTINNDTDLSSERAITAGLGINFTDGGAGSTFTVAQTPDSVRQKITAALNNSVVGTSQPIINFIESGDTTITVTEDIGNNRYDITIDSTAPVLSVAGKTGAVTLRINSDMLDVLISPLDFNDGGVLTPGTNGIYPNVLIWDGVNSVWRNRPADELFAIANNLSLDSLLDVEVNTTGSPPVDKSLLYFDFATQLWINGLPSDVNLYSKTELDGGALDTLYYTQTVLGTSGAASYVHWDKVFGYPTYALASQVKDYAYQLLDVYNYDSGTPPVTGQVLMWDAGGFWRPSSNAVSGGLEDLNNVQFNTGEPTDGQIIKFNSSSNMWEAANDIGSTTFLSLTDTPSTYGSNAYKIIKVNNSETGLEYSRIQDNGTQIGYGAAPQTYYSHYFKMDPSQITVMKIEADSAFGTNSPTGLQIDVTGTYGTGSPTGIIINNSGVSSGNHFGIDVITNGASNFFNYGVKIRASNGTLGNYGIAIADGSEGIGKFLKSVTTQGAANWADIVITDIANFTEGAGRVLYNGNTIAWLSEIPISVTDLDLTEITDGHLEYNGNTIAYLTDIAAAGSLAATLLVGNTTSGTNINMGSDSIVLGGTNTINGTSMYLNFHNAFGPGPGKVSASLGGSVFRVYENGGTLGITINPYGQNISFNDTFTNNILCPTTTAARDWTLPDKTGTIALTSDVTTFTEITDGHLDYDGNTIAYLSDITAGGNAYKQTADITGDDLSTVFVINHTLNSRDVIVQVYDAASPYDTTIVTCERTSTTSVTIRFAGAVPSGTNYRVVIIG